MTKADSSTKQTHIFCFYNQRQQWPGSRLSNCSANAGQHRETPQVERKRWRKDSLSSYPSPVKKNKTNQKNNKKSPKYTHTKTRPVQKNPQNLPQKAQTKLTIYTSPHLKPKKPPPHNNPPNPPFSEQLPPSCGIHLCALSLADQSKIQSLESYLDVEKCCCLVFPSVYCSISDF